MFFCFPFHETQGPALLRPHRVPLATVEGGGALRLSRLSRQWGLWTMGLSPYMERYLRGADFAEEMAENALGLEPGNSWEAEGC